MILQWIQFIVAAIFIITGVITLILATFGVNRFDRALNRMHGVLLAEKAGTTVSEMKVRLMQEADAIRDRTDYPLKNRNHDTLYGLLAEKSSRVKSAGNFRSTQKLMLRQGFATAYHAFRAIPEETVAVLVPYGEGAQLIDRLRGAKTMAELTWLLRQAQNDCASLYASDFDRLQRAGAIDELGETGLYVLAPGFYDAAGGVGIHG